MQTFAGRPSSLTVENSIVQGGWEGASVQDSDPLFVRIPDLASGDYGDLRLQPGSSAIDVGATSVVVAPPFLQDEYGVIVDLDNLPRIMDGVVDMGAYEFQPLT